MHRAIIFDFDGVIRHWDQDEARGIEERFGLPEGAIAAAAFDPALLDRAVTGRILDETWRLAIRNALVRAHGPDAAGVEELWSARQGRVDREMVTLVAEMRKQQLRTALLTNATTRLETDLQTFKLDQAFDVVINSSRIGYAKPALPIYRAAWHRLGFPAEQCIFIDDTPGHVEAAREAGMTGILFEGVEPLREALGRFVGNGTETG